MADPVSDDDLLAALLDKGLSEEDLARALYTLPDSAIMALTGWGKVTEREVRMPASVIEQAQEIMPTYRAVPHIAHLSERLTAAVADVEAGTPRFITVSMPPRHGKTEQVSVHLPIWLLRRNHQLKIGIISHSPTLATAWGRRIRRTVEKHGMTLGLAIAPDAGAVGEWETSEGGQVISRSVGQSLAGYGFNVLIVDDPVKDFVSAHSKDYRDRIWNWWRTDAYTRLEPSIGPDGRMQAPLVIVVQTRWHEDDLTGRLLSKDYEGDPADWEVISIPAIAGRGDTLGRKPGEPLYSPLVPGETREQAIKRLGDIRRSVGSYTWAALYQQSPSPEKGAIFDVPWWRYWTTDPDKVTADGRVELLPDLAGARVIDSWDAAFKGTESSDYVVGQRWAQVRADSYLLHQVRGRMTFTATIAAIKSFQSEGVGAGLAREHLVEDKANGPAIMDTLRREISGLRPVEPRGSKEARARAVTPAIESGNVRLPLPSEPGAQWVQALIEEARVFPNGDHDDQVDAMTQALDRIATVSVGVELLHPGAPASDSRGLVRPEPAVERVATRPKARPRGWLI